MQTNSTPQIAMKPAWRREDPACADDAKSFWSALGLLGVEERDRRASELCAVAYDANGAVAAVSTASLSVLPQLAARFALYRCAVAPRHRRHGLAYDLTVYSRNLIETWSAEHPEERILGLAAIIQAHELREFQRQPLWSEQGLDLNLVGYTPRGEQLRVAWFGHARLDEALS